MDHKERQTFTIITPRRYNAIPNYCFEDANSIFDIGCMSGLNAILSKHREHFIRIESEQKFLGIDIVEYPKYYLEPVIIQDFLDFDITQQFDLVIMLHTLEHIPINYWGKVFEKLKHLVSNNGYLMISTPYKEKFGIDDSHSVFDIQERTFRHFINDAIISVRRVPYRHFKEHNENILWAISRFIYRIITRHKYSWFNAKELIVIWKRADYRRYRFIGLMFEDA